MMKNSEKSMDKIIALCKNRGFVFAGSEIYGGLANSWDYGPLGVEFKNNVKKAWLKKFVQESPYNVGLDAAIIMNPQTWITTGHVSSFSDPLLDCKSCKARHRADKLIGEEHHEVNVDAMSFDEMDICAPRPHRASLSTLRTSSAPPAASCPSACARSARRSATRSPRATLPSVPASLSRWNANSSASPARTSNGSHTGRTTA